MGILFFKAFTFELNFVEILREYKMNGAKYSFIFTMALLQYLISYFASHFLANISFVNRNGTRISYI